MKHVAITRFIYRTLDILVFLPLLLRFVVWGAVTYLDSNYIRRRRQATTRKVLDFTTSSSYSAYKERGRLSHLTRLEEGGYLDRFYAISPFKPTNQTIKVSDRVIFIDWGTERFSRWKDKGLKYSRGAMILWDFFHYCVNLIKDEEINIIRGGNPFTSGLIALICSKLTHIPCCISIRTDFDLYSLQDTKYYPKVLGSRRLARKVQRLTLSHADWVTPLSEHLSRYGLKYGAKQERIRLIPLQIDLSKFPQPSPTLKKELGIEGKKVISFVARLVKAKYPYDVIQIAAKVCQQREDAVFLMVGDGQERKSLEELTHSLGLDDRVRFLGMQVWKKAMQIKLISDVSLGMVAGNSLVESAIAASPSICYDVEWQYELVRNGETGFLLPEYDIDGVAEAILKLLEDPDLAKRLGQNARKLAIDRHSIEKVRQIKISIYEELISMRR